MTAKEARELTNIIVETPQFLEELGQIFKLITDEAKKGYFSLEILDEDLDVSLNSVDRLEKLGYEVEIDLGSKGNKPKTIISW